jgi:hypothetical protein
MYLPLSQYLAEFFLKGEIFQRRAIEKIKRRALYLVSFSENRAVCDIIKKKNMVDPDRPQVTM